MCVRHQHYIRHDSVRDGESYRESRVNSVRSSDKHCRCLDAVVSVVIVVSPVCVLLACMCASSLDHEEESTGEDHSQDEEASNADAQSTDQERVCLHEVLHLLITTLRFNDHLSVCIHAYVSSSEKEKRRRNTIFPHFFR